MIKRNNNEMTNLYGLIEDFSKYLSHESADFTSLDTQFSTLRTLLLMKKSRTKNSKSKEIDC